MMAEPTRLPPPPSAARLAVATAAALFVAGVITVVAVLPAEYGVDPTGAGAALGLLAAPPPEAESAEAGPAAGTGLSPTALGPINYYTTPYATDHTTLELGPYEYVEYKYRLEQGASLHFAWESSATVLHDFHAENDDADGEEVSFDKMDRSRGFGTHTAPFAGMHGWFWENPGPNPIAVTLTSSGFYTAAMEYRPNRIRHPHQIQRALP